MFQFLEFLRVVAVGLIALGLFGAIFYTSLFLLPLSALLMISALVGLLIQPFLRAYHPYRNEVKGVPKHVELYIREALSAKSGQELSTENDELENALARAIYEFLYRTVDYSSFFTSRVNEQIRFFYFYYFVALALRISIPCSIVALLAKGFSKHLSLESWALAEFIQREFLLGIEGLTYLAVGVPILAAIAYFLSIRFNSAAKGIIITELHTRHVFLASEKERIKQLAEIAQDDDVLMELFQRQIDKEKGVLAEKKQRGTRRRP